jgi:hypothetical protein
VRRYADRGDWSSQFSRGASGHAPPPGVCPTFRIGGELVRTIAMVARFDHAAEVTLDGPSVELMYPYDDDVDRFFRRHAPHEPSG